MHDELFCVAERLLEDDASVVECMMNWDTVSSNQIHFVERVDKYDLFMKPEVGTYRQAEAGNCQSGGWQTTGITPI